VKWRKCAITLSLICVLSRSLSFTHARTHTHISNDWAVVAACAGGEMKVWNDYSVDVHSLSYTHKLSLSHTHTRTPTHTHTCTPQQKFDGSGDIGSLSFAYPLSLSHTHTHIHTHQQRLDGSGDMRGRRGEGVERGQRAVLPDCALRLRGV